MKRLGASFGSREPRESHPLFWLFNLITLITYLFSFLLFFCLTCPWVCLYLHILAITTFLARLLAYQHTWFCFLFHSTVAPIISFLSIRSFSYQSFFSLPPPGSCLPLFTFLFLRLPFSPSWLPSVSLLLCLLRFCVCSLCLRGLLVRVAGWFGLSGGVCFSAA